MPRFHGILAKAIAIVAVFIMWTAAALAFLNSRIIDQRTSSVQTSETVDICQPGRSSRIWFPIQVEAEFRQICDNEGK